MAVPTALTPAVRRGLPLSSGLWAPLHDGGLWARQKLPFCAPQRQSTQQQQRRSLHSGNHAASQAAFSSGGAAAAGAHRPLGRAAEMHREDVPEGAAASTQKGAKANGVGVTHQTPAYSFPQQVGFIGLGKIGSAMAKNMVSSGALEKPFVDGFDPFLPDASPLLKDESARSSPSGNKMTKMRVHREGFAKFAADLDVVISALPNDKAVEDLLLNQSKNLQTLKPNTVHISVSTISPALARKLTEEHKKHGSVFISAPVFARPDGLAKKEAFFPVAGDREIVEKLVKPLLETTTAKQVEYFGPCPEQANVVKLCGNFLICSAIGAMSEAYNLAEAYQLDRAQLHNLFSGTIFDCLIYKGYGHRVSAFDHFPYPDAHFALDLGHKDMTLVKQASAGRSVAGKKWQFGDDAAQVHLRDHGSSGSCKKEDEARERKQLETPFLDALDAKFKRAKEKGYAGLDWSAIAMI